jgi:hypothetical protein
VGLFEAIPQVQSEIFVHGECVVQGQAANNSDKYQFHSYFFFLIIDNFY